MQQQHTAHGGPPTSPKSKQAYRRSFFCCSKSRNSLRLSALSVRFSWLQSSSWRWVSRLSLATRNATLVLIASGRAWKCLSKPFCSAEQGIGVSNPGCRRRPQVVQAPTHLRRARAACHPAETACMGQQGRVSKELQKPAPGHTTADPCCPTHSEGQRWPATSLCLPTCSQRCMPSAAPHPTWWRVPVLPHRAARCTGGAPSSRRSRGRVMCPPSLYLTTDLPHHISTGPGATGQRSARCGRGADRARCCLNMLM